ncbi:MAG: penicillin acylase family protein [Dehalococcoidia bacterium]
MKEAQIRPEDCLARVEGELSLDGIDGPLRIVRDRWGIPHIQAASAHDAFFGQGFCIGQDRLFQLELRRKMAHGAAAAFLHKGLIASDRLSRTIGFLRQARREWEVQSTQARLILSAYADGVNAAITTQPAPYEFHLLKHEMEPWSPIDTLAIMKLVASGNQWATRLRYAKVAKALGLQAVLNLLPDVLPGMALITPSGARWTEDEHPLAQALATAMDEPEGTVAAGGGSNCWVIHGSRTTSGAPIVCGDPHLNIRIPAEWHVMHMTCPEFTVAGPCTPGAPGPLYYGHNTMVAWTMTHAAGDRWDVYRERIRQGPDGPAALYQGAWEPLRRIDETIELREGEPVQETIWETRHGFVAMGDPSRDDEVAAAKWGLSEPGHDFDALLSLFTAPSIAEARTAFRAYDTISGNFCFADLAGNIGYQYTGRIPRRPPYPLPVPGWDGKHEWDGSVPKEALPTDENPGTGYIATANNRTTGPDYPHFLSLAATPWRADRLREIFEQTPTFAPGDMPKMQGDLVSHVARILVARYLSVAVADPQAHAMQDLLRGWDCETGVESRAALIYMATTEQLMAQTVLAYYAKAGGNAQLPEIEQRAVLLRALRIDDRAVLNDFPSWDAAIEQALAQAAGALQAKFGIDPSTWRWGSAHWMTWRHNLGRDPELGTIFNLPDSEVGGDGATLWATQARYGRGSDHGVSYRQIFDLADLNAARILIPPGNSGQPGSPHYGDNRERWRTLAYHPLYINWPEIEANAEAELRLTPAPAATPTSAMIRS